MKSWSTRHGEPAAESVIGKFDPCPFSLPALIGHRKAPVRAGREDGFMPACLVSPTVTLQMESGGR
jgi:hypothetical protein